jgi:hypothetical protein
MRAVRILALFALAAISLAVGSASAAAPAAPTGLHGFLLRADEPAHVGNVFPRTPAFAWDPVPGATGYEFQLSTSNTFSNQSGDNVADNAIFYDTNSLTSPVAAPPLVLPWITGSPHSLYARVRATTPDGVSPWSADYGIDLMPDPEYPTPLPVNAPGLLRWTPIEGADAYQVWLVDLPGGGKFVTTRTNVLDEREFYTFHASPQWIGTVHWRIRAVRSTEGGTPANAFPVTTYSRWSPIYRSTNPPPSLGTLKLGDTISDVSEDGTGTASQPAHKLMPAFTWSGDTVAFPNGSTASAELFRVEVFSDRECLNMVYAGPVVGGQSWAPRAFGGSNQLPDPSKLGQARATFLNDGGQGAIPTFDGQPVGSAEDSSPADPTKVAPPDAIPAGATQGITAPADVATFAPRQGSGSVGAQVDLWDTYWPTSGYYWTVMPVGSAPGSAAATVAAPGASKGSPIVPVTDTGKFTTGETVTIGVAPNSDTAKITAAGNGLLTLDAPLNFGHVSGDPIAALAAGGQYQDVMLPQDLCGSGLIHKFGLWSEPSIASPQAPYVTGLSSTGKLVSATPSTSQFYGRPLVAWTPALRAEKYEVEWSLSDKPFVAVGNILTNSTAAILPLTTGNWYYRVRGFDYNLPTGAQQMSWSTPQELTISAPVFKLVEKTAGKSTAPKAKTSPKKTSAPTGLRRMTGDGFSMSIPTGWTFAAPKDSIVTFAYANRQRTATVNVLKGGGRAGRTYDQWATDLKQQYSATAKPTTAVVSLAAGKAIRLTATATGSGHVLHVLQYFVDAGAVTYTVTFEARDGSYAANAAQFAKMIAGFTRH